MSGNIDQNDQKWRQNKKISRKFHVITKVYTHKISERHYSRKFLLASNEEFDQNSYLYQLGTHLTL